MLESRRVLLNRWYGYACRRTQRSTVVGWQGTPGCSIHKTVAILIGVYSTGRVHNDISDGDAMESSRKAAKPGTGQFESHRLRHWYTPFLVGYLVSASPLELRYLSSFSVPKAPNIVIVRVPSMSIPLLMIATRPPTPSGVRKHHMMHLHS